MCRSFRFTRWPLAIAIVAVLCIVGPPAALAQTNVQLSAGPIYSSPLIVGQTNVPAEFSISNTASSGAVSIDTAAANHNIRYVPACQTTAALGASFPDLMCLAGDQDPGVFAISATGTGTPTPDAVGVSGCNGTTFTFTATGDAAGTVEISSAVPLVLPVGYTCHIAFTMNVLAVPTNDASGAAGIQTLGLGNVDPVDGAVLVSNNQVTGGGTGSTVTTVFACPPGGACCPDGYFSPVTTICRPSAGVCDVAESCPGDSDLCPPDGFVGVTTICRPSAGVCDVAESCPGTGPECPADGFAADTTICRESAGVCDVAESCVAGVCPADGFAADTTICRESTGICDVAESCVAGVCPADGFAADTTICRESAGVCDVAESCVAGVCPADVFAAATTECRASAGDCDVAESCPGDGADCPADGFQPSTTSCNAELCQSCPGNGPNCPEVNLCNPEACRTPGFWGARAGNEKDGVNITQLVLQSDGPVVICGQTIDNTDLGNISSAEEALCVNVKGDSRLQLARQLTAAALNCLANGFLGDCSNDPLFGTVFGLCNTGAVCGGSKQVQTACIDALDCLNNGGHPGVDGSGNFLCATGTCSDNQELCTPNNRSNCTDPATATCNPSPNCHDEPLPGFDPPGPASSSKKCNEANQNSCTIFSCP